MLDRYAAKNRRNAKKSGYELQKKFEWICTEDCHWIWNEFNMYEFSPGESSIMFNVKIIHVNYTDVLDLMIYIKLLLIMFWLTHA